MSLDKRVARFTELVKRFDPNLSTLVDPLIARVRIDDILSENLRMAVAIYTSRCLPDRRIVTNEEELLKAFVRNRELIKNCTPSGMMVPKREVSLEFNLVIRMFADIMESLNFGDLLTSWHVPLNVRFKDGDVVKGNLERNFPTEHIHSDSWAGESAESVTVMIPLFGDTERNKVEYYSPHEDFQEEWLGPQPSYAHNAWIAEKYTKINAPYSKGYIYLVDFSTLHASARLPGSGPRVSIDTTFAFPPQEGSAEKIHPWRAEERSGHETLCNVGRKTYFSFSHSWEEMVDSMGGYKHPSSLRVIEFKRDGE